MKRTVVVPSDFLAAITRNVAGEGLVIFRWRQDASIFRVIVYANTGNANRALASGAALRAACDAERVELVALDSRDKPRRLTSHVN